MTVTPSDPEQEYFKREEIRRIKEAALKTAHETVEKERERLRELHYMHCPKCGMKMADIEYRGVNVDTCFSCEGMYFDLGEVDKMMKWEEPGLFSQMLDMFFRSAFGSR